MTGSRLWIEPHASSALSRRRKSLARPEHQRVTHMANPLDDPDSLDLQALSRTGPAEDRVADRVYRRLRHAILSGKIEPRTRLVETEVAKALDTSRTPVREAISRLTSDQLVVP